MEKYDKSEVGFESPAKGDHHCSQCKYFEMDKPNHCHIVAGLIKPSDWCKKFERKRSFAHGSK